jgi:hypothetical protein
MIPILDEGEKYLMIIPAGLSDDDSGKALTSREINGVQHHERRGVIHWSGIFGIV